MNHGPASLDCLVCRFYWSTGAAEGLIMKDSGTNLRGEVGKRRFLCDSCCGQNVDLDREEWAGGPTIARLHSCACSFAMSVSARSLPRSGERGRAISKKGQKRSAQVTSFVCLFFFAAVEDVSLLEMSCFSSMVSSISGTSGERFLTITFWISSVKYRVYFLVVCLFFPRSRIDFQKKLDEKHKKKTSCPNWDPRQKLKNLRQCVVAMDMTNKCAKFHKDNPSGKNVKFNLARAIEHSETAVCVFNFV